MSCLTNAIAAAEKKEKRSPSPHFQHFQKAVKVSEREKLSAMFEDTLRRATFTILDSYHGYHDEVKAVVFKEWRFWDGRKFSFDYAWPGLKLAVEIEGGIWRRGGGAHSHPTNIMRDIEKYNGAVLLGWRVLRFSDYHLKSPYALECVLAALKGG